MFQPKPLPRNLGAALRDARADKVSVRRAAIRDLGRLACGEAWESAARALRDALRTDSNASVRAEAALSLANGEVRVALDDLLVAATDAHAEVRQMALLALGELGARGHVETARTVSEALLDTVPELRFQALIAAARLELPGLRDHLVRAFQDGDAQVRYIALRLGDEATAGLEGDPSAATLVKSAEPLLEDPELTVRTAAAMMLCRFHRDRSAAAIAEALNANLQLPAPEDQQTLIELAGELLVTDSGPGLRRHAFGRFGLVPGRFAWQAKIALARLGDARAQHTLLKELRSRDRDARTVAVVAVGRSGMKQAIPQLMRLREENGADPEALAEALSALNG